LLAISNFPQRFGMAFNLLTYAAMQTALILLAGLAFFLGFATLGFGILFSQ